MAICFMLMKLMEILKIILVMMSRRITSVILTDSVAQGKNLTTILGQQQEIFGTIINNYFPAIFKQMEIVLYTFIFNTFVYSQEKDMN
jgi:hypothetical protein